MSSRAVAAHPARLGSAGEPPPPGPPLPACRGVRGPRAPGHVTRRSGGLRAEVRRAFPSGKLDRITGIRRGARALSRPSGAGSGPPAADSEQYPCPRPASSRVPQDGGARGRSGLKGIGPGRGVGGGGGRLPAVAHGAGPRRRAAAAGSLNGPGFFEMKGDARESALCAVWQSLSATVLLSCVPASVTLSTSIYSSTQLRPPTYVVRGDSQVSDIDFKGFSAKFMRKRRLKL